MTTPEAVLAPSFAAPGLADTAHADLVARLANEIYRQGNTAATPLMPVPQQVPQAPQLPSAPSLVTPNLHGAPSLPGVPMPGGDFGNASTLSHLGTRSFGAPVGLPGLTGTAPVDTSLVPPAPVSPGSLSGLPNGPSLVVPNPHGAPSAPGIPMASGDFANFGAGSDLAARSGGVPSGLPGVTGAPPADTSLFPSSLARPGVPPGLPPGSDTATQAFGTPYFAASDFGTTSRRPATASDAKVASYPSVHPANEPLAAKDGPETGSRARRGDPHAPDFYLPSVTEAAARFPGGVELHRTIATDHPRANAFAHLLAPSLVPPRPAASSRAEPKVARDAGEARNAPPPNGRQVRTVDYGAGEPFAESDYYFLVNSPRAAARAPASARSERVRHPIGGPSAPFDVEAVRADFPALHQSVNGHPLVWLDNAATTHKPQSVIDATSEFCGRHNSNIHRAAHTLAARSTDLFESAREKVARFLNAPSKDDIVFLRGTTEAINLVANSYGRANIGPGDEIIVSTIEHHANIVPWQMLREATGAILKVIPVNDRGEIIFEQFAALLSGRTRIVSVTHVANALGTINPVAEIVALSHAYGVPVLIDAAQSTPHLPVDVQALDADFVVFSGHKVFGPTGIGALYGKKQHLEAMPPWQGGGHMIEDVTFAKTRYRNAPEKFEAGTPDIAGAIGLGAALDYMQSVGIPGIAAYEHDLLEYAQAGLADVKGLRLIGTARAKASVMSFTVDGHENADVAQHLDRHGIAVRAGHHCALPALRRFGVDQSVRASLAFYNTKEDVDVFLDALHALPRR